MWLPRARTRKWGGLQKNHVGVEHAPRKCFHLRDRPLFDLGPEGVQLPTAMSYSLPVGRDSAPTQIPLSLPPGWWSFPERGGCREVRRRRPGPVGPLRAWRGIRGGRSWRVATAKVIRFLVLSSLCIIGDLCHFPRSGGPSPRNVLKQSEGPASGAPRGADARTALPLQSGCGGLRKNPASGHILKRELTPEECSARWTNAACPPS